MTCLKISASAPALGFVGMVSSIAGLRPLGVARLTRGAALWDVHALVGRVSVASSHSSSCMGTGVA
eukprot:1518710-Amphidinium_carterae.1